MVSGPANNRSRESLEVERNGMDTKEGSDGSELQRQSSAVDLASEAIRVECSAVMNMLLEKNRQYGNSALEPLRIFSKASSVEQIRVRADDKLSRIARGNGEGDEDAIFDLIGYLIMLRVAEKDL